jgi:hypothetical protein
MAKILHHKQMVITVHGAREDGVPSTYVSADVLKAKLSGFLSALKEADRSTVGRTGRDVFVTYLKTGSAEIGFREAQLKGSPDASSFEVFHACASAINDGDARAASKYNGLAKKIESFSAGAGKKFSHISITMDNERPLRVDPFFHRQAQQVVREQKERDSLTPYFRGTAEDAFDGVVKEVDLRGATPLCKLILSGSGNEIDCTFGSLDTEEIKDILDKRSWVEGKAIYDGYSGLPARLEITAYRKMSTAGDPRLWRGQIKTDENDGWIDFENFEQ